LKEVQKISQLATIHYIHQNEPKGLGHAVWCARKFVGSEPFAVLLGDTLVKDKRSFLKEMIGLSEKYKSSIIGINPVQKSEVHRYGIVDIENGKGPLHKIRGLVEKPKIEQAPSNLSIFGRYILTPKIFDLLENQDPGIGNEIQLTDAISSLLKYENVYAHVFGGKSYDIGEKLGYLKTIVEFAIERDDFREDFVQFLKETVTRT